MTKTTILSIGILAAAAIACSEPVPQASPEDEAQAAKEPIVTWSSAVQKVGKVQQQRPAEAQGPQQQGELQIYEDQIAFVGNGVNTPAEVMERAIEIFAQHDPSLEPFVKMREAAFFAAQASLSQQNPKLAESPDEPIPAGEQFTAGGVSDLKQLLAPFKNNLAALREQVAEAQTALGGKSKATGHGVFSKARTIPVTMGGPGGEPAPVMGDLSVLGGRENTDGGIGK